MSSTRGVNVTRTPTTLHDTRGNYMFVQPRRERSSHKTEIKGNMNANHMDIESLFTLLQQAQNDLAILTQERDDLLEQLDILCNNDKGANEFLISTAARREIQELIEENEQLQDQIRRLTKWQNDFESQLSHGHHEAEYSIKELLDIHQNMEQNIQELQTYISQGISTNTALHSHIIQNYVTDIWNSFLNQRPHWKMVITENIQLKKHISDLEEALQMKHTDIESETYPESDINIANHLNEMNPHEKELERFTQLLDEATEQIDQIDKEKAELEKVNSKWKEFGDYLKTENKELEKQLHQALDDIQRLEEKIEDLEDNNPNVTETEKNLKDRNDELEKELRKTKDNMQELEYRINELLLQSDNNDRSEVHPQSDMRTDSRKPMASSLHDEEKLRTGRVVEELASHLTELVLQAEREKSVAMNHENKCHDKDSDENLVREDVLLKQLDDYQRHVVELQIQLDDVQQELNSQKLRNIVLETQTFSKKSFPRGTVPIKTSEDASTNTEHFGRSTAFYTGVRIATDHQRATFLDIEKPPLETSL